MHISANNIKVHHYRMVDVPVECRVIVMCAVSSITSIIHDLLICICAYAMF